MMTDLSPEAAGAANDAHLQLEKINAYAHVLAAYRAEQLDILRSEIANQYRLLVGVHPDDIPEFVEALKRVEDGGGRPVADVISVINHRRWAA